MSDVTAAENNMMTDRMITGDCLDIMPTLPPGMVNLVFTSPPYPGQVGNCMSVGEWLDWLGCVMGHLRPTLAPNAVVALNVMFKRTAAGWHDTRLWMGVPSVLEAAGLHCLDVSLWVKTNAPMNGPMAYADAPGYEPIFIYTNADDPKHFTFNPQYKPYAEKSISANGAARIGNGRTKEPNGNGARQTNVISLPTCASDGIRPRARGVSFPIALPSRFIKQYSRPGDVVLDFCAGVGTTCRVAVELGRRAIGIEIDPDEADKARQWLADPLQVSLWENW